MAAAAKWDAQRKCITHKGIACTGAHPFLSASFYPKFVPPAVKQTKAQRALSDVAHLKENAMDRGKRVDSELGLWTRMVSRGEWQKEMSATMHPWTRKLIRTFAKEGLKPHKSQGIVCHPPSRTATFFDLEMRDAKGGVVLVEIKTCLNEAFVIENGALEAPLQDVPSSRLEHAKLQVIFTGMLWEYGNRERRKLAGLRVIQADGTSCHVYDVPVGDASKRFRMAIIGKLMARIKKRLAPKKPKKKKKESALADVD